MKKGCLTVIGIFVALGIVFAALGGDSEPSESNNNDKSAPTEVAVTETLEVSETPEVEIEETTEAVVNKTEEVIEEEPTAELDENVLVDLNLSIMEENFGEIGEVTVDRVDKVFKIIPYDDDIAQAAYYVSEGEETLLEEWMYMQDNFVYMSESMGQMLPDYSIALINSMNTENVLLIVRNGSVIYSVAD